MSLKLKRDKWNKSLKQILGAKLYFDFISRMKGRAKISTKNKIKIKARKRIFVSLRNGKIKRQPCYCGNTISETHHIDYRRPLFIKWLCKKHHSQEHFNKDCQIMA